MATIASLHVYPIKSCRGIDPAVVRLGQKGLETDGLGDRQWAIIDANGRTVTQRERPMLALVAPRTASGGMIVSAPGMTDLAVAGGAAPRGVATRVTIWHDTVNAIDEGDEAARWLTAFLGFPARLARFDENEQRASDAVHTGGIETLNRFSDGFPILLLSRASLADLNERWKKDRHPALPMDRFRPNIVIDGIGAYDEDHLASLACREVELKPVKACPRCSIPSVDQSTGEVGPAPIEKLATYRFDAKLQAVVFGQNVVVVQGTGAVLRVGQELAERWNF
jgi:uncharacterized protein YcbX